MAKENDCANCDHEFDIATLRTEVADTKKKLDEFTTQNKDLTGKLEAETKNVKDATDALNQYREAEKKALIDSVVKHTDFKAEDLKDKSVEDLRTIHSTVDHVKIDGTVKSVRGAKTENTALDGFDPKSPPTVSMPLGRPERAADGSVKWVVD